MVRLRGHLDLDDLRQVLVSTIALNLKLWPLPYAASFSWCEGGWTLNEHKAKNPNPKA